MKYNYEFKKELHLYRESKWLDTPNGIKEEGFHDLIRKCFRLKNFMAQKFKNMETISIGHLMRNYKVDCNQKWNK